MNGMIGWAGSKLVLYDQREVQCKWLLLPKTAVQRSIHQDPRLGSPGTKPQSIEGQKNQTRALPRENKVMLLVYNYYYQQSVEAFLFQFSNP